MAENWPFTASLAGCPMAPHLFDVTEDPVGEGDGIDAHVQHRAAEKGGVVDAVLGREVLTVVDHDGTELAEHPVVEDLADDVELGQELRPHRLAGEQSMRLCRSDDLAGLRGVDAHRLFDQYVLSCCQCRQRAAVVFDVRGADVDDVDVRIGQ